MDRTTAEKMVVELHEDITEESRERRAAWEEEKRATAEDFAKHGPPRHGKPYSLTWILSGWSRYSLLEKVWWTVALIGCVYTFCTLLAAIPGVFRACVKGERE